MEVQIDSVHGKPVVKLQSMTEGFTVENVKQQIHHLRKGPHPNRLQLRLDPKGKGLPNEVTLRSTGWTPGQKLFLKDLGPQMDWGTVFLCEYIGPIVIYLIFYSRPSFLYGNNAASKPYSTVANLAALLWVSYYVKRILETIFVHRFSHATMPIRKLFENSSYYWGFGGLISYFVSHPSYEPPTNPTQVWIAVGLFLLFEYGNGSIHALLSGLRPPGSKVRKIPYPNSNPMTALYNYVSCPNYTYEALIWLAFTLMTQSIPALLFALGSLYLMTNWALARHRNYRKEFPTYPKNRTAIIPFII